MSIKNYKFKHILQSSWLADVYKEHLPDTGFFVEIGMGHTTTPESRKSDFDIIELHSSNTIELLQLGWSGLYIEPVKEFCDEASLLFQRLGVAERAKIINIGASDRCETVKMYGKETMIDNGIFKYADYATGKYYEYPGTTVNCVPTRCLIDNREDDDRIDLLSVDVEGYEDRVIAGMNFDRHRVHLLILENTRLKNGAIQYILPEYFELLRFDNLNSVWINRIWTL